MLIQLITSFPITENGLDNNMPNHLFASPWEGFRLFASGAINKIPLIFEYFERESGIFIKIRQLKSSVANYEKICSPISKKIAQTQNDSLHRTTKFLKEMIF
jgi:hypothetical protein